MARILARGLVSLLVAALRQRARAARVEADHPQRTTWTVHEVRA
jgi:hypothetical protein